MKVTKAALRREIAALKQQLAGVRSTLGMVQQECELLKNQSTELGQTNVGLRNELSDAKKKIEAHQEHDRATKERITKVLAQHDGECKGLERAIAILGGQRQNTAPGHNGLDALFPAVIVSDVLRMMMEEGRVAEHDSIRG